MPNETENKKETLFTTIQHSSPNNAPLECNNYIAVRLPISFQDFNKMQPTEMNNIFLKCKNSNDECVQNILFFILSFSELFSILSFEFEHKGIATEQITETEINN